MSDLMFNQIIERIKTALNLEKYSEVADFLGMRPNTFHNRRKSGSIPYEEIITSVRSRNMSLDWVFYGQGAPFIDQDVWVAPVAEIDPELLGLITGEIWHAFQGGQDQGLIKKAIQRGSLTAQVFNKVAFIKNDKIRHSMIKEEAARIADYAKCFEMGFTFDN